MPPNPTLDTLFKNELSLETRTKIAQALNALQPVGVVSALIRAGNKHSMETLGFFLLPLLDERIRKEPVLFGRLLKGVSSQQAGHNYQIPVLDILDKIAREKGGNWEERYQAGLVAIVTNPVVSAYTRAKALRQLTRVPQPDIHVAVKAAIDSREPALLNAAGAVLCTWLRKKQEYPPDLFVGLLEFCDQNPNIALEQPGVLRALVAHSSAEAKVALEALRQHIQKPEQRDAVLAAVGTLAPADLLGSLLKDTFSQPTDKGMQAVRGIFAQEPKKLGELYKAGFQKEYLTSLHLALHAARFADLGHYRTLLHGSDMEIAQVAQSLHLEQVDLTASAKELIDGHYNLLAGGSTSGPAVTGGGYATGLQKGDAIYKSLGDGSSSGSSSGTDIFGNHWHAGLFTGFCPSILAGTFSLGAVHVTTWSYTVHAFSVSESFIAHTLSLSAAMQNLKDRLTVEFGCTGSVPFQGARGAPAADYYRRQQIIDTALAMIGKNIEWTFVDQLDYYWWDWDGSIDDIDELRCDGLVEYAYEVNGVRVCGGIDAGRWNVSYPDADYAENHNNFHGYGCTQDDYEHGDLCPRIQAGDIANDTSFITLPAAVPVISNLKMNPPSPCCVWFYFDVQAELSKYIYVRLMVRRAGDAEFCFVKTEDPLGTGEANGGCLEGTWCLKQVDIRRSHNAVGAFWLGKTTQAPLVEINLPFFHYVVQPETPGPDYQNQPGTYEFRLQCIDEGGNVSDEWSYQLDLTWQ